MGLCCKKEPRWAVSAVLPRHQWDDSTFVAGLWPGGVEPAAICAGSMPEIRPRAACIQRFNVVNSVAHHCPPVSAIDAEAYPHTNCKAITPHYLLPAPSDSTWGVASVS